MMRSLGFSVTPLSLAGALALTGAMIGSAQAGPFSSFEGSWTGRGTVSVNTGAKEALRCRARYTTGGGGTSLSQNLTCASDSYKFNVVSNLQANGNAISGTWEETSRGASGQISGTIGPTQISAQVSGVGFSARIGIAARGKGQSVTISPTGTDITNVSVTMSKR